MLKEMQRLDEAQQVVMSTLFVGRWVGLLEGLIDGTDVGGEVGLIEGG